MAKAQFHKNQRVYVKPVGTWALVSAVYEDQATGQRSHPLGLRPRGCQIATAGGRWIAVVTAEP